MAKIIKETERLLLREWNTGDAEAFYNLNANREVLKYTGDSPFTNIEEANDFIQNYDQYEKNGYGRWAVIEKSSKEFIGFCGLKLNEEGLVDLGFRIFQEKWGKGYATEAAIASLEVGFNDYKIQEIIGRADQQNIASVKVLEKIGMKFWKLDTTDHISDAVYCKISRDSFDRLHNTK